MSRSKVVSILASAVLLFCPLHSSATDLVWPVTADNEPVRELTFVFDLLVDFDGKVIDGRLVSSNGYPDQGKHFLGEVVRTWKMKPGTENGKPVRKWGRFTVTLDCKDNCR